MSVEWEPGAASDLDQIAGQLSQFSSEAARRFVQDCLDASERLSRFPLSGRVVPEYREREIREVLIGRYRLLYFVRDEKVLVLTVHPTAVPLPELN